MGGKAERPPAWVRFIEVAIERLGQAVSWLGLAMVLVTTVVVVLRYGLGVGSVALQETVAYMHASLFMIGASYALLHDAHVRVDVLYRGWSRRAQARVDLLGTLFLLVPFCVFAVVISAQYVAASWRLLEGSPEAGGLPGVFLVKTLIPVMAVLLLISGLARLGRCWLVLREDPS
ncbi:MAG: TRAP transporter small permease subunit [Myxococcota bacterium]